MSEYVLLRHRQIPNLNRLEVYQANGGFAAFRKVLTEMQPADVLNEVKTSGLRGRGGAGFPTGMKWSFFPIRFGRIMWLPMAMSRSRERSKIARFWRTIPSSFWKG